MHWMDDLRSLSNLSLQFNYIHHLKQQEQQQQQQQRQHLNLYACINCNKNIDETQVFNDT